MPTVYSDRGTANPGLWASLDPQRSHEDEALILDLGRRVKQFLTPDDVNAVALMIHEPTGLRMLRDERSRVI